MNGNVFDPQFILNQLMNGQLPSTSQLLKLNDLATEHFLQKENLITVQTPLNIISDLHGQFYELVELLQLSDPTYNFIFLGDLVDRGKWSVQTLSTVLCLVLLRPQQVNLIRGNHEDAQIASNYSFYKEVFQKITDYPQDYIRSCCKLFDSLPLAAYEPNLQIYFVHGGISPFIQKLEQINHLHRLQQSTYASQQAITDMLWSDPNENIENFSKSERNSGVYFGYNICKKFCYENNLSHIFRGHQVQEQGYKIYFNDMLTSLWSAAGYSDRPQCLGSICMLEQSGNRQYVLYQRSLNYDNRSENQYQYKEQYR